MGLQLFKKQTIEIPRVNKDGAVYNAIMNGLNEMERQGVDRVILNIYESEPNQNATGRWISSNDTNYYPFEMLDETEQGMIKDGKHYRVIALVRDNVGDVVRYDGKGGEIRHRTHVVPFLPALKKESNLNYVTSGGVYTRDDIKQFATLLAKSGWTADLIEQRIKEGIQEYHDKTKGLMEGAGVYKSLQEMEQRKDSPFEKILIDMHNNIASAKRK